MPNTQEAFFRPLFCDVAFVKTTCKNSSSNIYCQLVSQIFHQIYYQNLPMQHSCDFFLCFLKASLLLKYNCNLIWYTLCLYISHSIFMVLLVVLWEQISRPESFLTALAGNGNAFNMVCFNVSPYGSLFTLFSTQFTIIHWLSIWHSPFSSIHHWISFLKKLLQVSRKWTGYKWTG